MSHAHIDTSTPEAWAHSILRKVAAAALVGLNPDYSVQDFLADTHGGDMPWKPEKAIEVETAMRAHPNHERIMDLFIERFGVDFWADEQ